VNDSDAGTGKPETVAEKHVDEEIETDLKSTIENMPQMLLVTQTFIPRDDTTTPA
jgi:hypothetical protein